MGARLFGTDGVRGLANAELTPQLALAVAAAAVRVLHRGGGRPVVVLGRDPRASGEMLAAAVIAGLTSAGADVLDAGIVPTPAVAFLVEDTGADFGVMLSASHNPMPDNGIKLFGRGGHKLADEVEDAIAAACADPVAGPTGAGIGRHRVFADAAARYADHLLASAPTPLAGLRVVVDAAHGAAAVIAPEVYRKAGADVVAIGVEPDGLNINDGVGSTHLEPLRAAVLQHGGDVGLAHDGDADRCLAIAADGTDVDGDAILAIEAVALHEAGRLRGDAVATTVMTNLGFTRAMAQRGIGVVQSAVGDRYVLEALRAHDLALGGEQSGHVVHLDAATTGDGLLTGLRLLGRMAATGRSLADLATVMTRLPQVLVNLRVADRGLVDAPAVRTAVLAAEARLGTAGRVLLRASGTEPLIRVMVEAPTAAQAAAEARAVADAVLAAQAGS